MTEAPETLPTTTSTAITEVEKAAIPASTQHPTPSQVSLSPASLIYGLASGALIFLALYFFTKGEALSGFLLLLTGIAFIGYAWLSMKSPSA